MLAHLIGNTLKDKARPRGFASPSSISTGELIQTELHQQVFPTIKLQQCGIHNVGCRHQGLILHFPLSKIFLYPHTSPNYDIVYRLLFRHRGEGWIMIELRDVRKLLKEGVDEAF